MAKTRMINTRIWNDGYVAELDPTEKLLFIYLLTNQATSICGIYELPIRTVAFETGIAEEKVRNILSRFGLDEKIYYMDGWVVIKNFIKHQNQGSPKVLRGIEIELAAVPEKMKGYVYGIDTLSHPNSNLNSNSNLKEEPASPPTPVFERKIREKESDYSALVKDLAEKDYLSAAKIHNIMLTSFLPYWLERGENARKARWEKEKAFDYLRRARTWISRYHEMAKDFVCREGIWHGKGESCHHQAPELDYKSLPTSNFAKSIADSKRINPAQTTADRQAS